MKYSTISVICPDLLLFYICSVDDSPDNPAHLPSMSAEDVAQEEEIITSDIIENDEVTTETHSNFKIEKQDNTAERREATKVLVQAQKSVEGQPTAATIESSSSGDGSGNDTMMQLLEERQDLSSGGGDDLLLKSKEDRAKAVKLELGQESQQQQEMVIEPEAPEFHHGAGEDTVMELLAQESSPGEKEDSQNIVSIIKVEAVSQLGKGLKTDDGETAEATRPGETSEAEGGQKRDENLDVLVNAAVMIGNNN